MKIEFKSPAYIYLPNDSEPVKRFLTFYDKSVQFLISKHQKNLRWKSYDPEAYYSRMNELKKESKKCLLMYDEEGRPYTYSGLAKDLKEVFKWEFEDLKVDLPDVSIPWLNVPQHQSRYYQDKGLEFLIKNRHAAIQLPTGSGKSRILFNVFKQLPHKTLIIAPLGEIAKQLYDEFVYLFGKKYIGFYGGGKKEHKKLCTIATTQSIMKLQKGEDAWNSFQEVKVVMSDESHQIASEVFARVVLEVCVNAPYKFFVSATQTRTDGSELLLKGLIGPVVYKKSFKELVKEGFLADPKVKIFKVKANNKAGHTDPKTETRNQLYNNDNVNALACNIVNKFLQNTDRQILVLIEEFRQYTHLMHRLGPHAFAHGGVSADAKEFIPQEHWNPDNKAIIKDFNDGKCRVLVGTSAITTGVDLRPTGVIVYLMGGSSEIKVKQAAGRGTRVTDKKKDVWIIDFEVVGSPTMERHISKRIDIYEDISDSIEVIG